jgi:hypothetical protein
MLLSFQPGQSTLGGFGKDEKDLDLKIAFNDLTAAQKKKLPEIDANFKVYVHKGRVSPKLKDKVVKETLFEKDDIVSITKKVVKESDRNVVIEMLLSTEIPPVVIQQWLMQGALNDTKAWNTVVLAESYTGNKEAYAYLVGGYEMLGAKFKFPKKIRGE